MTFTTIGPKGHVWFLISISDVQQASGTSWAPPLPPPLAESWLLQSATGPRCYNTGNIVTEHGTKQKTTRWIASQYGNPVGKSKGSPDQKKTPPCIYIFSVYLVFVNIFYELSSLYKVASSLWRVVFDPHIPPKKSNYQNIPSLMCMY